MNETLEPEELDPSSDPQQEEEDPSLNPEETSETPEDELDEGDIDDITGLPKDVIDAIVECSQFYNQEDAGLRVIQVGFWKKLENYFNGIQRIFWDYTASDWKSVDLGNLDSPNVDPSLYDKIVNIYRAHGESLISALSIKLPKVVFYPDDADVAEDIDTAKSYSKVSTLIDKHNNGILLFMKGILYLWNCGIAACYIHNEQDSSFGTFRTAQYGPDVTVEHVNFNCPLCGGTIQDATYKNQPFDPETAPSVLSCPVCNTEVNPNPEVTTEVLPQIVGYDDTPKSRTKLEVFSPLFVQMPFYARNQAQMPYLRLKFEQHFTILKATYPELSRQHKIPKGNNAYDTYERWARSYSYLQSSYTTNLVTTVCQWLRPWAFEILEDEELVAKCKKYFPNGCYAVLLNDTVAEARNEDMDSCWSVTQHPLATYLHADPLGKPLAPIQELRNEATDLAIETFEHSIPEEFVDNKVLNFDKYKEEEARPGMRYPVEPIPGQALSASFYSSKPATLNEEIKSFISNLDTDGQFVIGDFPSLYGGNNTTGSKTAAEYSQSRSQALQRLNVTWTMLKTWWADIMGKAVPLYIQDMVEDEKYTEKSDQSQTGYVNVWVKQTELTGKIGRVEADSEEELPTSFSQLKQVFTELITLNNETLNAALYHPNNSPLIAKALGVTDFYIPGSDQRDKQYSEFAELLKTGPLPDGMPSIDIDLDVDDNLIHIQTCKAFLVSPTGLAQKTLNPAGYENIKAHLRLHLEAQMQEIQDANVTPAGVAPDTATDSTAS